MRLSLYLSVILAVFFFPSCVPLIDERFLHKDSLSWTDYESMDRNSRYERTTALKQEINDCTIRSHCADLHYQLAMAYLSGPAPSRRALVSANTHLKKAAEGGRNMDHALLLSKVLRQLIQKSDQQAILEKQIEELEINLERAKILDLETLGED